MSDIIAEGTAAIAAVEGYFDHTQNTHAESRDCPFMTREQTCHVASFKTLHFMNVSICTHYTVVNVSVSIRKYFFWVYYIRAKFLKGVI